MTEPRVWFNKTFSGVHNVIRLLRDPAGPIRPHVLCTHTNPEFVGFEASDHCGLEPLGLTEEAYVDWCLERCARDRIDVFIPGRQALAIARRRSEFETRGVRLLLAASPEAMDHFEDKPRFYRDLDPAVALVPRSICVNTAGEFAAACATIRAEGHAVCFKPGRSTGGMGFRILDDAKTDLDNMLNGESVRITTELATTIFAKKERFRDVLVMEYLDGAEYSLDCLAREGRLLRAVARRKPVRGGGSQLLEDLPELTALAERITAAFRLSDLFNIQVRFAGTVPKLLEINARMSGGIYFACLSGLNLPAWAVALACGAAREEDLPRPRYGQRVSQQYREFTLEQPVLAA